MAEVQPTTNAPGAPPNARRDRDRGAEDESVGWESMDSGLEMPEAAPEPPWAPESPGLSLLHSRLSAIATPVASLVGATLHLETGGLPGCGVEVNQMEMAKRH